MNQSASKTANKIHQSFLNILKVSTSNLLKLAAGVLVGFLLPKMIGVTEYGHYKTFTLYATYATLFHFGFSDGIYLKYGGKSYNELNKSMFRAYTRFLFCLEFLIATIGLVLALTLMHGDLRFVFLCLVVYLIAFNLTNYYQLISQITGRFSELSIRNTLYSVLTIASIVTLFFLHHYYNYRISYRLYTFVFVTISLLLCLWYIFSYRDITFGKCNKRCEYNKIILFFTKIGLPLMIANFSSSLIMSLDRQFVNIFFDTNTYAIYAFAYNMLSLITTGLAAISTVLYPTLKRIDGNTLISTYSPLVQGITIVVYVFVGLYFPLCWFIRVFLPAYIDSIRIFQVILPGLALSSAVTIVMHNFYKAAGKNNRFFRICIIILLLSAVFNYSAYKLFGTPISISLASIIVLFLWYCIVEHYIAKTYHINNQGNLFFIILMCGSFYIISSLLNWYIGFIIYLFVLATLSFLFYKRIFAFLFNTFRQF